MLSASWLHIGTVTANFPLKISPPDWEAFWFGHHMTCFWGPMICKLLQFSPLSGKEPPLFRFLAYISNKIDEHALVFPNKCENRKVSSCTLQASLFFGCFLAAFLTFKVLVNFDFSNSFERTERIQIHKASLPTLRKFVIFQCTCRQSKLCHQAN